MTNSNHDAFLEKERLKIQGDLCLQRYLWKYSKYEIEEVYYKRIEEPPPEDATPWERQFRLILRSPEPPYLNSFGVFLFDYFSPYFNVRLERGTGISFYEEIHLFINEKKDEFERDCTSFKRDNVFLDFRVGNRFVERERLRIKGNISLQRRLWKSSQLYIKHLYDRFVDDPQDKEYELVMEISFDNVNFRNLLAVFLLDVLNPYFNIIMEIKPGMIFPAMTTLNLVFNTL